MRIARDGERLLAQDRGGAHWVLGLLVLAGGVVAIAAAGGLAANAGALRPWERLATIGIGAGAVAGALWWLGRSPLTRVEVDPVRRTLRLRRLGVWGRQAREIGLAEVVAVHVDLGADDDGGTVARPAVSLRTGERVLLSALWSHDRQAVERAARAVAEALRLPAPAEATSATDDAVPVPHARAGGGDGSR